MSRTQHMVSFRHPPDRYVDRETEWPAGISHCRVSAGGDKVLGSVHLDGGYITTGDTPPLDRAVPPRPPQDEADRGRLSRGARVFGHAAAAP